MGCGSSSADQPKPSPVYPPAPTQPVASPGASSASAVPSSGIAAPSGQQAPAVYPAVASGVAPTPQGSCLNPGVAANPGSGGTFDRLSGIAKGLYIPRNMEEIKENMAKISEATGVVVDRTSEALVGQMDSALASSDNKRINSILDSAMAGTALGANAPESMRRAASQVATRQLTEAIASEDPKQLKGALVAAKRLNATEVPAFNVAVEKYKEIKKLPPGWDVKNMVLQRVGDRMVAKMDVGDPKIQENFQRLLNLTHRKVYTRDRLGQPVPDRLELVSVTTITNEDLWGDYMARRETIRREVQADGGDFSQYTVDTQAESEEAPSAASITTSLAEDFAQPLMAEVNEVFLFHGTSAAAADAIATGNFKVNLAGSNAGTLYGRGVYMAENATKSDEYTRERPGDQLRYLLLCRTLLGRAYYSDTKETDPRQCEEACLRGKFHSVLGDRRKCRGTFREFVVFDEDQVYPNYILAYKRINPVEDPKKNMMVICPPDCPAGAKVRVQTPDGGPLVEVMVPPGISAGQQFMIQY